MAYSRLVLSHLPQREKALSNMVSALNPGGWVLIEDYDFISPDFARDYHPTLGAPPAMTTQLYRKIVLARDRLLEEHGADLYFARKLYLMMRSIGLTQVGSSAVGVKPWKGGSAWARHLIANAVQSRKEMVATGILSEEELEEAIKMMNDPEWTGVSSLMVSA